MNSCEVDDTQILLIGSILFYFTLIQIVLVLELAALFILYLLLYSLIFHMAQNHMKDHRQDEYYVINVNY